MPTRNFNQIAFTDTAKQKLALSSENYREPATMPGSMKTVSQSIDCGALRRERSMDKDLAMGGNGNSLERAIG